MPKNVFLDDRFAPFEVYSEDEVRGYTPHEWVHVTTVAAAIEQLAEGDVQVLSLDYDLMATDPGCCGMDVLRWLAAEVEAGRLAPPKYIWVHTWHGPRAALLHKHIDHIYHLADG